MADGTTRMSYQHYNKTRFVRWNEHPRDYHVTIGSEDVEVKCNFFEEMVSDVIVFFVRNLAESNRDFYLQ